MNTKKSSSCLQQFSWEEWDNQMIVVLYRSDRRFVVKRYIERVLANSTQWQQLAQSSFSNIEPIAQAYSMTENEVKLMHHIFSWHLNGTLTFPIIGGLDQLLDWEDVLDFIQRSQQTSTNELTMINSPSVVPTIPVGILCSTLPVKKTKLESKKGDLTPIKKVRQETLFDENPSSNQWVQINNVCIPYLIKSEHSRLLPYHLLLDCDLLTQQEQSFLLHFTIKSNSNDIQILERIISSSSSIQFKLQNDLLLIDIYHLIFGISKVVYVKLLQNQRDVNKSYKTVLAQCGGTITFRSHPIPFITLGKLDYILLDALVAILHPTTRIKSSLRRCASLVQSHELDYLRLVQFYQRKHCQDDSIVLNQQQLLLSTNEVQKYINKNDLVIDMLLTQYQQVEYEKLRKEIQTIEKNLIRKPTKRKASIPMTELQNTTTEGKYM